MIRIWLLVLDSLNVINYLITLPTTIVGFNRFLITTTQLIAIADDHAEAVRQASAVPSFPAG